MAASYGAAASFTATFAGPFAGGSTGIPKICSISLPVSGWKSANSPYSQMISVDGVSTESKIDLQADSAQMAKLLKTSTMIFVVNDQGTVTAYAVGEKPKEDLTFQGCITEAVAI